MHILYSFGFKHLVVIEEIENTEYKFPFPFYFNFLTFMF